MPSLVEGAPGSKLDLHISSLFFGWLAGLEAFEFPLDDWIL